jgi:PAS domain S-box-containing protein
MTGTDTNGLTPNPGAAPQGRKSQAIDSLLLDQLPIGIFHKDREGRYTFVNSCFCLLQGATADEYLGKIAPDVALRKWGLEDVNHPDKTRATTRLNQGKEDHEWIMQTGGPIEAEEHHIGLDGKERYLHAIKGPLIGPDGAIIGSQGILLDVTERKRVEAQLANERDLLKVLLDFSSDYIYFKDRQSRFIRGSTGLARHFNLGSAEELVGKSDRDFQGEEHAQKAFEDEQEIIRTGQPIIGKTEKETFPDGRVTWALSSKMPFSNSDGEIIGTFGISKNITAFKEAETKLEQLHRQLLQTSREAGMAEVATSVLHNVGNVLNSINVSAELLLDAAKNSKVSFLGKAVALFNEHAGDLDAYMANDPKGRQLPGYLSLLCEQLIKEQQRTTEELESVRQNIEHVKEIVAMQQNYAKICGVTETIKVTDIVEDALRMNTGALARHEVDLVREYTDDSAVSMEKHKVLQILVNLIRNAKYACDESGRNDKQITLRISKQDPWIRIAIVDNGVGIPAENLTRIFNHGFTTRKEGHGFALHSGAIAATELGGSLTAQSDGWGHGAVFTLNLPCGDLAGNDTAFVQRRRRDTPAAP